MDNKKIAPIGKHYKKLTTSSYNQLNISPQNTIYVVVVFYFIHAERPSIYSLSLFMHKSKLDSNMYGQTYRLRFCLLSKTLAKDTSVVVSDVIQ